jgi:Ser/Thr protein kinase RdoA (MazF antagonist)
VPPDLQAALAAWGVRDVLSATVPATGTIHQTLLLRTAAGAYALRAYRYRERRRVEFEHTLIAHARKRNVPAVAPIPLPGAAGATILEREGRFYALFPRAAGHQRDHTEMGPAEAVAMGRALAEVHRALADVPHDRVEARSFATDTAKTLAGIAALEGVIQSQPTRDERDRLTIAQLGERRSWLLARGDAGSVDLPGLERQVIHGDYQQTNLFFEGSRVSAIIDWDQAYVAPRAWEVVRTLHLVFTFDPAPCGLLLDAYRAVAPMPLAELDVAAAAYSHMRAHDLWLYQAVYLEGNDRVRSFLPAGHFAPLSEAWSRLKATLQ